MSEERKPEESLMDDETLFFGYFKAALGPSIESDLDLNGSVKCAKKALEEHRKLFPKKVPQDSPCDCGSECVKCSPNKLDNK